MDTISPVRPLHNPLGFVIHFMSIKFLIDDIISDINSKHREYVNSTYLGGFVLNILQMTFEQSSKTRWHIV